MKESPLKTHTIIIRVPPEIKNEIKILAKISKRSLSDYMRLMMEDAIKEKITF